MGSRRRDGSLSRGSHNRSKLIVSLLEDHINRTRFSKRRIADDEGEDEEDPAAGGGGAETDEGGEGAEGEAPAEEEEAPPPPPPPPPPDPNKYSPIPYTFRIPVGPQTREVRQGYARCPPFYLQLDHTLAVIWCLFSKQPPTKPLGIAQLQWALNFLKTIKNQNGEQPKDITLCIQAIEDQLLDHYAALVNEIAGGEEGENEEGEPHKGCSRDTCEKIPDAERTASGADVSGAESAEKIAKLAKDVQSDVVITNLPFSVNYTEMMKSSPNAGDRFFSNQACRSLTDSQIQQEIEHLKKATAGTMPDSRLGDAWSRDDMLRFLNSWRKEQLDKVQAELKRLHSIENFIDNVDRDNAPSATSGKPAKRVSIKDTVEEREADE